MRQHGLGACLQALFGASAGAYVCVFGSAVGVGRAQTDMLADERVSLEQFLFVHAEYSC